MICKVVFYKTVILGQPSRWGLSLLRMDTEPLAKPLVTKTELDTGRGWKMKERCVCILSFHTKDNGKNFSVKTRVIIYYLFFFSLALLLRPPLSPVFLSHIACIILCLPYKIKVRQGPVFLILWFCWFFPEGFIVHIFITL